MKDIYDYSLKSHNTFGIDARCRRYVEFATTAEAQQAASLVRGDSRLLLIGGGSNLLLTTPVYEGTVVRSGVRGISLTERPDGTALMSCGSGERWDDVVAFSVERGFCDLACLSLIPGDVGASAVQNIGAYGAEAGQFIDHILAVALDSGQTVSISGSECRYAYRDSRFKYEWLNRYLITHVVYRLNRATKPLTDYGNISAELQRQGIGEPTARQLRQAIITIRRAKLPDPAQTGNAGSFFKNPIVDSELFRQLNAQYPLMPHYAAGEGEVKIPAAWLIEQCGWKGKALGRAGVYGKQALVLVNLGSATGNDILQLCRAIQADVEQRFGIRLQPEVNII